MKKVDTKENKNIRIAKAISDMKIGEGISPTNLFKNINIHPNTGRDLLDLFDTLKEIGFMIIRKDGKIKTILRTDESIDIRREIRQLKADMNDVKTLSETLIKNSNKK